MAVEREMEGSRLVENRLPGGRRGDIAEWSRRWVARSMAAEKGIGWEVGVGLGWLRVRADRGAEVMFLPAEGFWRARASLGQPSRPDWQAGAGPRAAGCRAGGPVFLANPRVRLWGAGIPCLQASGDGVRGAGKPQLFCFQCRGDSQLFTIRCIRP